MEALSPPSAVLEAGLAKRNCHTPAKRAAVADLHAPSTWLPLRFILTGAGAFVIAMIWLASAPDLLAAYHYGPEVVAATHLLLLGWIGSVLMGAVYQLVPVALETRLYSERLARWHYLLHVIGFVGMVLMFRAWNMKQVGHFGSCLALGVGFFVYNLGRTLVRAPRWTVVATGIASSLGWLCVTVLAGLFLASAKCWPQINPLGPIACMHAHAHLAGLGVFVTMIVGVSYRVVPMFTLSELKSPRRAGWSLLLLNAGLAGVCAAILASSPWKLAGGLLVVAGLTLYLWEMAAILRARKRRLPDWALIHFLTGIGLLAPLSALGLLLAWPGLPATALTTQLEGVYGMLAFLGVISLALLGMLYKILPFLVWYLSYGKAVGRCKTPALAELYSRRLQVVGYWSFLAGLVVVGTASAMGSAPGVRAGGAALCLSAVAFALNVGRILSHVLHPRLPAELCSATTGGTR